MKKYKRFLFSRGLFFKEAFLSVHFTRLGVNFQPLGRLSETELNLCVDYIFQICYKIHHQVTRDSNKTKGYKTYCTKK